MRYLTKPLNTFGRTHTVKLLDWTSTTLSILMAHWELIQRSRLSWKPESSSGRQSRMIWPPGSGLKSWKFKTLIIWTRWDRARHRCLERILIERTYWRSHLAFISNHWWLSVKANKTKSANWLKSSNQPLSKAMPTWCQTWWFTTMRTTSQMISRLTFSTYQSCLKLSKMKSRALS